MQTSSLFNAAIIKASKAIPTQCAHEILTSSPHHHHHHHHICHQLYSAAMTSLLHAVSTASLEPKNLVAAPRLFCGCVHLYAYPESSKSKTYIIF